MKYNYNNRKEVPEKYRWDLTKWFKADEDWYKELEEAKKHTKDLKKYEGNVLEKLYEVIKEEYELNNRYEKLYAYAMLKQDEDLSVSRYEKMFQEIEAVYMEFQENISFITPEILHSKDFQLKELIKKDERLKDYQFILEELAKEKEYTKDKKTEEIITALTKDINHYNILASTMNNSTIDYGSIVDEEGNKVKLTTGNYRRFSTSKNQKLRKKAYLQFNKERIKYEKVMGSNLITFMSRNAAIAKIRGYNNTKEMFFKNDSIPTSVQETLKKNALKNVKYLHEYYDYLKKLLKKDKLYVYDLSAPIVDEEKKYSVEEAQKYVYESTKVLGNEYSKIVKKGFDEHWIDYMPYQGKPSGGYSLSIYGNTSNILMNFNGVFDSIGTLAHEMGHAVNNYFRFQNVPMQYTYHDAILGEVASLSNEIYLTEYIIHHDFTKEEKILAIVELLRTINSNFFGAIMENTLEDIVYEKLDKNEVVNSEDLSNIMEQETNKYYGKIIEKDKYRKYMWISRSHYFTPYYLYKYATSICGAVHFASRIIKGDKETLKTYQDFLKSAADKNPYEHLKSYGIDLLNEEIYNELFEYYQSLLDKLKELTRGESNE